MRTFTGILSGLLALVMAVDVVGAAAAKQPAAVAVRGFSNLAAAVPADAGYTPQQIADTYNITPLLNRGIDGSGQTIALVEIDGFVASDIQAFDAANNLPDPAIQEIYYGGEPFTLRNDGEAAMDIEWAHALAPRARLQVYYIKGNQANAAGWAALGQTITTAVANGATSISLSFGACNATSGYKVTQQAFARALQAGVSVFVASGDTGALPGPVRECGRRLGVGYPASDPSVVSVGGTSLLLSDANTIEQEVAWRLSGGGKGKPLLRPSWQIAPSLRPGHFRYAPDVSFVSDPSTGVAIYYDDDWQTAGGTSLGAPAWAALWTLVNQAAKQAGKTPGAAPALLYRIGNSSAYSQAFNDVTAGSNGHYSAGKGWDAVTGWGTPDVSGLATAVQALAPATSRR